ncbi:MAG: spore cortex biosynthesis protein YabQ [Clostridiales bacterium]|nr:spore cortex biosynthesis protein YabQ [Clostridiales bacterium]
MILSMRKQGLVLLFVCLLGFGFGFLYDILRLYRRGFKTPAVLCMAEDFIYWVFAALTVFGLLLGINYGEVRLYTVLGFMGGMVFYYLKVSPIFTGLSLRLLRAVKRRLLKASAPFLKAGNNIKLWLKKKAVWVIIYLWHRFKPICAVGRRFKRKPKIKKTKRKKT